MENEKKFFVEKNVGTPAILGKTLGFIYLDFEFEVRQLLKSTVSLNLM
jgi:hypothetical protein